MRNKFLFIVFILFLVVGTGAFADHPDGLGIGVDFTYGYNGGLGPALSLKLPSVPVFWTVGVGINANWFGLTVAGDYYFIDRPLVPDIDLSWFLGFGLYFNFSSWKNNYHPYDSDSSIGLGLGARLPIGLSWQPRQVDILELFIDVVPSLGLSVSPFYFPAWDLGFDFGIRLWI